MYGMTGGICVDSREKYLKDMSVAERQIYILSLLSENPQGFRIQDIVDRLAAWEIDVKPRTIQRDIDELSLSYGISEEQRGKDIYYMADKYYLKNVDMTISDLMSIAFMQELLDNYRGLDVAEHGMEFLNRIVKQLGIAKRAQFLDFKNIIKDMDANRRKNLDVRPEMEHAVRNAIDQRRKLKITYYSWNRDESTERVIHPYQFVMIDGYMNVAAYCELRQELRNFRISRMTKVEILNEGFEKEQNLIKEQKPFIHISGKATEKLVLQFDEQKGRYVEEYDWARADRLEKLEDGNVLFYKDTALTDEVKQYVLGFGSHVRVLEPRHFAEEIHNEAVRIAGLYEGEEKEKDI